MSKAFHMSYVFFNGEFIREEEIKISLTNRNFLYGDGLFETVRSIDGKPVFVQQHIARLKNCMSALELENNNLLTEETLNEIIYQLNTLNKINAGGRARIIIFRNEGGTYMPVQNSSSCIIRADAIEQNYYQLNAEGIILGLYNEIKKPINTLSLFKTCNSLLYVLASVYSQKNNYTDCVIINEQNNICEATSSNIFWIERNKIYTTPLTQGCVNGVLRTVVMQNSSTKFQVIEKTCSTDDLLNADEIFLTNSIGGFRWAKSFLNKKLKNEVTEQFVSEFISLQWPK